METRLIFCNLGFQNFICVNDVKMIVPNNTRFAERKRKEAKDADVFFNAAQRKQTKSLVFMRTGEVIGVSLYPATIARRFAKAVDDAHAVVYTGLSDEAQERREHAEKAPKSLKGYADGPDEIFDDDEDDDMSDGFDYPVYEDD